MRPYLAIALFALAALAAACGGAGGSTPGIPTAAGPANAPLRFGSAYLSLKIPAQTHGSSVKRPAYVSPNTQSVQILAMPVTSASPSPASPQTFAVTTPSPCAQNADGSKTCTFNVQAPLGRDQFLVKTFAVASPGPNDTPLAVFESGVVNVATSGSPPPLNFTLTGVVDHVDVAMQSPDPSITPSTQIGTIGTAITSGALFITPRDHSGAAIMTDTFEAPVTVTVGTAGAPVSLMLNGSQCTPASTVSGTTATITCAKDLGKLTFSYDGTIARDGSGNIIDRIAFEGWPQPNGSPAPAFLALASATFTSTLPQAGMTYVQGIRFAKNPGTGYTYVLDGGFGSTSVIGTVDPANPSNAQASALPFEARSVAVDNNGQIWVPMYADSTGTAGSALYCYPAPGASPAVVQIQTAPSPAPVQPYFVTTDAQGNVWYYGTDTAAGLEWAGYIPAGSCSSAPSTVNPTIQVGFASDSPQDMQPQKSGGVFLLSANSGIYAVTTGSSGTVTPTAVLPGGYASYALSTDSTGRAYASFNQPNISELPLGGNSFSTTIPMPATQQFSSMPYGMTFDPNRTTFAYADNGLSAIGIGSAIVSNIALLPVTGGNCSATLFDTNGDPWGACIVFDSTTSTYATQLIHIVRTSTWNAFVPSNPHVAANFTLPIGILETGNSGPFTVTLSDPTAASTAAPWTGFDHTVPITFTGQGSSTISVTVTDVHGRSITRSLTWSPALLARRHSVKKR